jgi:23S rRNA (cytosine1962-C5)-methyltransferase
MTGTIVIKHEREKPIINQHPWVFSGAIEAVKGSPQPSDIVTVVNERGKFLARGYWNPKSQIQVRLLTWHDEPIDDDWWQRMLKRAIDMRQKLLYPRSEYPGLDANAYRLINAENDFIPGLIVDRYDQWLVLQALTLGIDQRKKMLAELLYEMHDPKPLGIYERSDVDVRGKEGLQQETGLLLGEEPPERIWISEGGMFQMGVDVRRGHKTGFYLDQTRNRWLFFDLGHVLRGRVLNLFSYTGAFGLYAIAFSADKVVNVDSSLDALNIAEENLARAKQVNSIDWEAHTELIQADVFDLLHDYVDEREQFDVIICDPPKFAHNAQQVERAARGYKDLNLNCFRLLKPGGYLMTFSCSGAISADLFQKIVFGALADTGRQAQILRHLGAGEDHPVALTFPEGAYLKGLLLRVY